MRVGLVTTATVDGLQPLRHRLELEGDEVVPLPEAELVLTDLPSQHHTAAIALGGVVPLPDGVVAPPQATPSDVFFSRWWDDRGWGEQTLVGFPLVGLMDRGLGPPVPSGCVCKFVERGGFPTLFDLAGLEDQLVGQRGFVSVELSHWHLASIRWGIPSWGLYAVLEGVQGPVSEWFARPTRLLESWTVATLLSRWPFPHSTADGRVVVGGLSEQVEKHFWLWGGQRIRQQTTTASTVVGVATGWSQSLEDATSRVVGTLKSVSVPMAQWRGDALAVARSRWLEAREMGLVG